MDKKTIIFDKDLDNKAIGDLIESVNKLGNEDIVLYFSSCGGSCGASDILTDYMNFYTKNIKIVIFGSVQSAAVTFLMKLNNPTINIIYLDNANGMLHLSDCYVSAKDILSDDKMSFHKRSLEDLKWEQKKFLVSLKLTSLTQEEIDYIESGQDLYLNKSQLQSLIDGYRKLHKKEDR